MEIRLADGLVVEAVYYGSGTLCVSCQVGCAAACPFCASGSHGLRRQLTADEMLRQVETLRQSGREPARITISGIGEPLHNLSAVSVFLRECERQALPVSLTTIGSPLGHLEQLLAAPHNGVMLSLHAGTTAVHRQLVPGGPDLDELWSLLEGLWPRLSRRRRRRIGINYLLLAGLNDGAEEMDALICRLRPFPEMTLHLLAFNQVAGIAFSSPPTEAIAALAGRLRAAGIHVRRANRWRQQADGGCGTLLVRSAGGKSERMC